MLTGYERARLRTAAWRRTERVVTKVMDRVQKLLRLAQSSNPHEAALAAEMAQSLMLEHRLEVEDLSAADRELEARIGEEDATAPAGAGGTSKWKGSLAHALARGFGCTTFLTKRGAGGTIRVVGRDAERQTVVYLFKALVPELERMCDEAQAKAITAASSVAWRNSFFWGAVEVIHHRLAANRKRWAEGGAEHVPTTTALALRRDDAALATYMSEAHARLKRIGARTSTLEGREEGRQAGRDVDLGGARPKLGPSKPRLR